MSGPGNYVCSGTVLRGAGRWVGYGDMVGRQGRSRVTEVDAVWEITRIGSR